MITPESAFFVIYKYNANKDPAYTLQGRSLLALSNSDKLVSNILYIKRKAESRFLQRRFLFLYGFYLSQGNHAENKREQRNRFAKSDNGDVL